MKKLRSGYTTGACAAAAAKAAVLRLLCDYSAQDVEIPFPDGRRVRFPLAREGVPPDSPDTRCAGIIKDAGDDPDVTNGALICARARISHDPGLEPGHIEITGGEGVGVVTKPGLAVETGRSAINPVPMLMIREGVLEALSELHESGKPSLTVEIIVPRGLELANKTLNERLGIIGGISILGTTGIVRPISAEAWTATITASMDVAEAGGCEEIVLSTGRTSEAALQKSLELVPEAYIMMGDYLEFSLKEARRYSFKRLHMAGMWGKILKAALRIPQTHVRFGALEISQAIRIIGSESQENMGFLTGSNTAREIYERLVERRRFDLIEKVCRLAAEYHVSVSGIPTRVYLVHHDKSIKYVTE